MTNHLRTLLLNLAASGSADQWPGEEYVPAGFQPLNLSAQLANWRSVLFGASPDRAMLNVRLAQLLPILHASELASYVTDLDPRITYYPRHSSRLHRALVFGVSASQESGAARAAQVLGDIADFTDPCRLYRRWRVEVIDPTTVQVTRQDDGSSARSVAYSVTGGMSSPVSLHGSNLSLSFADPAGTTPVWQVTGLARPAQGLAGVWTDLGQTDSTELFAGDEPWSVFRGLWEDRYQSWLYRLGAWALALGYRLNQVWAGGG